MTKLGEVRRASGKSQQAVADALGLERTAYNRMEIERTQVPVKIAIKLAKLFNMTVEELFPVA
jgi:DNA-binding XRE family transcriptional regulator